MKKITFKSIFFFATFFTAALIIATATCYFLLFLGLQLNSSHELSYVFTFCLMFIISSIFLFRTWLLIYPTPIGPTADHQVWFVHTYQLFYLIIFNPIIKGWFIPVPLMRAFYLCIGAKMGENSYTGGVIYDAHLVIVGSHCILGEGTLLTPHQIEGQSLGYFPILIGNNVTVGAHAVILPGVSIGDNAIVASGSIVPKGTQIKSGEIWGGVPARLIKTNNFNKEIRYQDFTDKLL